MNFRKIKMWTIIKFDKKKIEELKKNFNKKLGSKPTFYIPKIKIQKNSRKKLNDYEFDILGDYAFCYHRDISKNSVIYSLKNTIGLKYFLEGFSICQKQIIDFIQKCKNYENADGFLRQDFFDIDNKINFQFTAGPFNKFFFRLIEERRKKYVVTLNSFKINISKKRTLFKTI